MLCICIYKKSNQILSAKTAPFNKCLIVAYLIRTYNPKNWPAPNLCNIIFNVKKNVYKLNVESLVCQYKKTDDAEASQGKMDIWMGIIGFIEKGYDIRAEVK